MRPKWFSCAFMLGFLQLICKASLIFKSNLELALSIILKQRELYKSKHVAVECRCLKIWDLLPYLIWSSILVLKWRQVSSIWIDLQLAQVNLYTKRDFKLANVGLMLKFSLQNPLQSFGSLFLLWCERLLMCGNLK